MATYPVEFHRRLEQKWESRIEQIPSVTGTVPPPRRPMTTMMMTRMQTKRMESSPTSRRSSANPRETRGYGDGIALPGLAGPGAAACDSGDWIPEPVWAK